MEEVELTEALRVELSDRWWQLDDAELMERRSTLRAIDTLDTIVQRLQGEINE